MAAPPAAAPGGLGELGVPATAGHEVVGDAVSPSDQAFRLWVSITRSLANQRIPATPSARGMTATWVRREGSQMKYCGSSFIRSQSEIIGENVNIR